MLNVALTFFAAAFFSQQVGLLKILHDSDPSIFFWLAINVIKALAIFWAARRANLPQPEIIRNFYRLSILFVFLFATLVEVVCILPATPFLKNPTEDKNGVILQTLNVTCVPSCVATICRLYKTSITELESTETFQTLLIGSLPGHIISGCRKTGFQEAAFVSSTIPELLKEDLPFIITFNIGISSIHHAIAVIGIDNKKIYLADPLRGLIEANREKFLADSSGKMSCIRLGLKTDINFQPHLSRFQKEWLKP